MNETHWVARVWHQIKTAGRLARFNAWRKSQTMVTRGFLLFRDVIVILLCGAIVTAGVTTVSDLRADDCTGANERRTELHDVALRLLDNDRFLLELADRLSEDGLPDAFIGPLTERYDALEAEIDEAYAPTPCG